MRYNYKDYDFPGCSITQAETHEYPKSKVKVGDTVIPIDGSWALCVKDGELVSEAVAYEPKRQQWRVVATEGRFPTGGFQGGFGDKLILPGQHYPWKSSEEFHPWNDTMMCRLSDGKVCFIRSQYLKVI